MGLKFKLRMYCYTGLLMLSCYIMQRVHISAGSVVYWLTADKQRVMFSNCESVYIYKCLAKRC